MTQATDHSAPEQLIERKDIPSQFREATLVPASWNEADRTVEVVWTTGARRRAYDWWAGESYDEELDVSPAAVDMARFEAGTVQVLDSHRVGDGVAAILGIASRGWIEGGQGKALLRLSGRADWAGIVEDIKAGIIRSISFGYSVQQYVRTEPKARSDGGTVPLYRATRWTPHEISFVTVPADAQASTRSAQTTDSAGQALGQPCEFVRAAAHTHEEHSMSEKDKAAPQPGVRSDEPAAVQVSGADVVPIAQMRAEIAAAEQKRAADITELCERHGVSKLAPGLIRGGADVSAARETVLEELAKRSGAGNQLNVTRVHTVQDEMQTRLDGMAEALMHRVDARAKLTDAGRQFRGLSLLELGRELLESHGVSTRGLTQLELSSKILQFRSGFMTTSDFASLTANVASKRLRSGYDENPGTYQLWARRAPNAPNFKTQTIVQLSAMPDLLKVNEHGEFKYGSVSDGAETYALTTFGRIVPLTRQAIINDDLRAFDRMIAGFGASAARLENRTVYQQLTANAAMSDTVALFAAGHANNATGGGSALSLTALSTARTAMRVQKGLAGEELNLAPAYLIVPAALEQTSYQLTSPNFMPATPATVNEFRQGGRSALTPIVEPVLDANSATAWYLAALTSQVDTVEYCYLDGAEGPVIESEVGFDVDGVSYKCRLDFAAKALDWRGLYRGVGA